MHIPCHSMIIPNLFPLFVTYGIRLGLSVILVGILSLGAMAQDAPMGYGNAEGSGGQPRLVLWLDGTSVQTSGTAVTQWNDKSGNNHHFVAETADNRPTFLPTGGPGGKPAVSFDGVDDRLGFANFPLDGNAYTIYFVYKSTDDKFGMFSYATGAQAHEALIHYDNGFKQKHRALEANRPDMGGANPVNGTWDYGGLIWNRTSPVFLAQFGKNSYSQTTNAFGTHGVASGGYAVIGDIQNSVNGGYVEGDAFQGEIAEIIVYQGHVSRVFALFMRTYLWSKYGEPFKDTNTAWDRWNHFAAADAGLYNELIGIGREDITSPLNYHSESRLRGLVIRRGDGSFANQTAHFAGWVEDAGNSIVSSDLPDGVERRWSRVWEMGSSHVASSEALISFDFGEGIGGEYPQNAENFVLLKRQNNTGEFQVVTDVLETSILDDEVVFRIPFNRINSRGWFYTIGTTNNAQSTLDGSPIRTWYCVGSNQNSHHWSQPSRWTLDGSTNPIYFNPANEIPQPGDNVVIGSGKSIHVDVDNITGMGRLVVNGTMNVSAAAAPSFAEIAGNGTIRCQGHNGEGNFPLGDSEAFADVNQGGTVEFYGSNGYTQSHPSPSGVLLFNRVKINMSDVTTSVTLAADMTHNGLLEVVRGTLIIHDGSNARRTITSKGRVTVNSANSTIRVCDAPVTGSGNGFYGKHRWFFEDDLEVQHASSQLLFTNRTGPPTDFTQAETKHWIEAHFTNPTRNQRITANGTARFSRIVVNKGTDNSSILTISANGENKFQLLGSHVSFDSSLPSIPNAQESGGTRTACLLVNGTLEVTDNVYVPLHPIGGNYSLSENARLWVNGGRVSKDNGNAIVVYGRVLVSKGEMEAIGNGGFTLRDNGVVQVDGGEVTATGVRTSTYGSEHIGGLIINGGETNLIGTFGPEGAQGSYYVLSLTYPGNLFQMTGGTLRVKGPTGRGLIFINSDPQSTNVTGGKVIAEVANNSNNHRITSRAAFWDLELIRTYTGTNRHILIAGGSSGTGDEEVTLAPQPLVVKGSLTIGSTNAAENNDITLNTQASPGVYMDVYIGRNLTIHNGASYIHHENTTYFDGPGNSDLDFGISSGATTKTFHNVVLNKNLPDRWARIVSNRGNTTRAMEVQGLFDIQNGYFDNQNRHLSLKGDLINRTMMGNPSGGSTGVVYVEGDDAQEITSYGGVFHNLTIDNENGVSLLNDGITVRRNLRLLDGNFFIGPNKVRIEGSAGALTGSGFGSDKCLVTNGRVSAGGLEIVYRSGTQNTTFPVGVPDGTGIKYTPAIIRATSGSLSNENFGYIRVTPVDTMLLSANISAGNPYLDFFWRVGHSEFAEVPNVSHSFYYSDADVVGNEDSLAAGRVLTDMPFERSVDSLATHNDHVNTASNIIYFNAPEEGMVMNGLGIPVANADYSAGNRLRFKGKPKVYFSRSNVENADWNVAANWNELEDFEDYDPYYAHSTNSAIQASDYPKAGDLAYIGFDPNNGKPHVYEAPLTGISASQVNFTPLQGASGNRKERYYGPSPNDLLILRPSLRVSTTSEISSIFEISGEGALILDGNVDLTHVDIGNFLAEDSSIVILNMSGPVSGLPPTVPNLFVGSVSTAATTINSNLVVRNKLEVAGNSAIWLGGDIHVHGDVQLDRYQVISAGAMIRFQNFNPSRTLEVEGDLIIKGAGSQIDLVSANTSFPMVIHRLVVHGNIIQNAPTGGIKLALGPNYDNILLELRGTGNHEFINSAGPVPLLGRIIVDKGFDTNSSFAFNSEIIVHGDPSIAEKPIELRNGLLILDHENIDVTLSSLGSYPIPATAGIELGSGKVRIHGIETGLLLAGSLEINDGYFELGNTEGENNFIEYASSGIPKLYVNGGVLRVGSQIRTDLTSDNGNLDYRQTGGQVYLGVYGAPQLNRPVLRVRGSANGGSRFDHTGGTLTFVRGLNTTAEVSMDIRPQFHNVGGDAKIVIGNEDSPVGGPIKNFGINTNIELNKLFLDNSSGNGPEVRAASSLILKDTLSIDAGASYLAGNFPVTLKGDFHNDGSISFATHNNAVLTLDHPGIATVSGGGDFILNDLVRTGGSSGETVVDAELIVNRDLTSDGGEMSFGSHSITVLRNAMIDGTMNFDVGSEGLVMQGTSAQVLNRSGPGETVIDILTINSPNSTGVNMNPSGAGFELVINKELRMSRGVFGLQGNLLVLGEDCEITPLNAFSNSNMINTFGSLSNHGIRKHFPAGYNTDVTLPIGVTQGSNRYTPVHFWFDPLEDDNTGDEPSSYLITVTPVYHEIIELPAKEDSVLSMYFTLDADVISNVRMNVAFQYDQVFVPVDALEPDYIAARVYSTETQDFVNKILGEDAVDELGNIIPFRYYDQGKEAISGHYFAGVNTAIPDFIPTYSTINGGGDVLDEVYSPEVPGGGAPSGARVNIVGDHELTFDVNSISFYRTDIAENATLTIDGTSMHRLGMVTGTGTIKLRGTGNLPNGNYQSFFHCFGGKLIYEGQDDDEFEILSNLPIVRKVDVVGHPGSVLTVSNNNVSVCENLTVDGPTLMGANNTDMTIMGDLIVLSGQYDLRQGDILVKGDVKIEGTGSIVSGNMGTSIFENNLELSGAEFGLGSFLRSTTVMGDIIKTSGVINNGIGGAALVLNGLVPQTIDGDFTGASRIPSLTISNPHGVTLLDNVEITDTLRLTDGLIHTDQSGMIVLGNDGVDVVPVGGTKDSFVNGPMRWQLNAGSTERVFPVGDLREPHLQNWYRPVNIASRSGNGLWEVQYYAEKATENPSIESLAIESPNVETISVQEHWRVNRVTGSGTARVGLSWGDGSAVLDEFTPEFPGFYESLVVMEYNEGAQYWESRGGGTFNYNAAAGQGSLIANEASSFSEKFFTLGSEDAINPLPVTWLYFAGRTENGKHILSWATASELNADRFVVERSIDGRVWSQLGSVDASGNSNSEVRYEYMDVNPPAGRVYYRLKQYDFDGKHNLSPDIVTLQLQVSGDSEFDFVIFPNPTESKFNLLVEDFADEVAVLSIYDLSGRKVYDRILHIIESGVTSTVEVNLDPGVYVVRVISGDRQKSKPLVVR